MVRDAVAAGIDPADAILMASFNPAQWHRLATHGAIAPGYVADLLVLGDLERFVPELVLKRGRPIEEPPRREVPEWVRQTVRVQRVTTGDFEIPWEGGTARAIGLIADQVVTESLEREPLVVDGRAVSDPERDLVKIAVIERHLATGRVGLGFVSGSGLRSGALASTVAHDAHNLVVVGADDEDMTVAVRPTRGARRGDRRRRGRAASSPSARSRSRACCPTSRSTSSSHRAVGATKRRSGSAGAARRRS